MPVCDYDCGQEGKYKFKNDKWCCENNAMKCPELRRILGIIQKETHVLRSGRRCSIDGLATSYYYDKLSIYEEVRIDPNNLDLIQVRCKWCKNWFNPTRDQIWYRLDAIKGKSYGGCGESHLYCSNECKKSCPLYGKTPEYLMKMDEVIAGHIKMEKEQIHPYVRQLCFERDNYECQKCWSIEDNECHHILPATHYPLFINDVENCITLCKECHNFIHTRIEYCKYWNLRKLNCKEVRDVI